MNTLIDPRIIAQMLLSQDRTFRRFNDMMTLAWCNAGLNVGIYGLVPERRDSITFGKRFYETN